MIITQKSLTQRKHPWSWTCATGVKNNLVAIGSEKNIYRPQLAFMQESRAVFIGGDVIREIRKYFSIGIIFDKAYHR